MHTAKVGELACRYTWQSILKCSFEQVCRNHKSAASPTTKALVEKDTRAN